MPAAPEAVAADPSVLPRTRLDGVALDELVAVSENALEIVETGDAEAIA